MENLPSVSEMQKQIEKMLTQPFTNISYMVSLKWWNSLFEFFANAKAQITPINNLELMYFRFF